MSTKKAFKKKMDDKIACTEAEVERFTARGMGLTAAAKVKHDELVEELEHKVDETKASLRELGKAEDQLWEALRDEVMSSWGALQFALRDAIEGFEPGPPVAGLHGNDDGNYPYGEGWSGRLVGKTKLRKEHDHGG
jgi:hypothetical protein